VPGDLSILGEHLSNPNYPSKRLISSVSRDERIHVKFAAWRAITWDRDGTSVDRIDDCSAFVIDERVLRRFVKLGVSGETPRSGSLLIVALSVLFDTCGMSLTQCIFQLSAQNSWISQVSLFVQQEIERGIGRQNFQSTSRPAV
jgi:hypothetical protein